METKTARFATLVKAAGRPEVVTLWDDPSANRPFRKAVQEGRVLTVVQENVGTKKDSGIVGFTKKKNASYLVFPKTLKAFGNARIAGIKYDLLREARPSDPVKASSRQLKKKEGPPPRPSDLPNSLQRKLQKPKAVVPSPKSFKVTVRTLATVEETVSVEASNILTAQQKAIASVRRRGFEPARAKLAHEIVEARKVE